MGLWLCRYGNGLHNDGALAECVKGGSQSKKFTCLVVWLTTELGSYSGIDEHVSAAAGNCIPYLRFLRINIIINSYNVLINSYWGTDIRGLTRGLTKNCSLL